MKAKAKSRDLRRCRQRVIFLQPGIKKKKIFKHAERDGTHEMNVKTEKKNKKKFNKLPNGGPVGRGGDMLTRREMIELPRIETRRELRRRARLERTRPPTFLGEKKKYQEAIEIGAVEYLLNHAYVTLSTLNTDDHRMGTSEIRAERRLKYRGGGKGFCVLGRTSCLWDPREWIGAYQLYIIKLLTLINPTKWRMGWEGTWRKRV